jgi:anti-sigma regulatory factor (Ser/Thr protein kinase)
VVLLPHQPSSVGVARHQLCADLQAHGIRESAVSDASLVLSELLSNAIRHAHPLPGAQIRVSWTLSGGSLEVMVSDGGGATRPRPVVRPTLSSLGGRGLSIVDLLCRNWGVRDDDPGVTVWAVLPAGRARNGARQLQARLLRRWPAVLTCWASRRYRRDLRPVLKASLLTKNTTATNSAIQNKKNTT